MAMYAEKMLGIHNVHRKMLGIINAKWENAQNYRCKTKEYWETTKYAEKIHGIVNAKCKNAGKRQSMLKNARNHQYKVKE